MEITKVITGVLDENCYIIKEKETCLVVDPGADFPKIKDAINERKVLGVLITHSHSDHIGALRNFLTNKKIKIFKKSNLVDNENVEIGDFNFKPIFTPGHSSDSVSFYFEDSNTLFSGDFLFKNTIGRTDLPTGNQNEMMTSIEKIKEYDKNMIIYPGHGDETTLDDEINNNMFF